LRTLSHVEDTISDQWSVPSFGYEVPHKGILSQQIGQQLGLGQSVMLEYEIVLTASTE
jgi:hypothetical protein